MEQLQEMTVNLVGAKLWRGSCLREGSDNSWAWPAVVVGVVSASNARVSLTQSARRV